MFRSVRSSTDERSRRLPGDELLRKPIGSSLTQAITIRRPVRTQQDRTLVPVSSESSATIASHISGRCFTATHGARCAEPSSTGRFCSMRSRSIEP